MPAEQDWDYGIGFALADDRFVLDKTASTYTEDNQVAGVAEPANESPLVVRTSGAAPSSVLQLMTQQGGLVDGSVPADFVFRQATSGNWYGFDDVANPRGYLVLDEADGTNIAETKHYQALTLPNGTVAVLYQSQDGSIPFGFTDPIVCGIVSIDGSYASYEVRGRGSAPSVDYRPAPCLLGSGRLLCFSWDVDEGSETAQVRMDYSDDYGQTWALGRSACLPEAIDVSAGAWGCLRIVAVETEGGVAMFVHLVDGSGAPSSYRDVLRQYASRDQGHSFELVSSTNEDSSVDRQKTGANPVVVDVDGVLFVAWVGVETSGGTTYPIYGCRVANAYEPVFIRDDTTIVDSSQDHAGSSGTPATLSGYDIAACRDHGGPIYLTSRLPTALNFLQMMYRSDDGARTWNPVGLSELLGSDGSPWMYTADSDVYLIDVAIAAQSGGITALGRKVTVSGYRDDSLHAIRLGGPSTVTFPPFYRADTVLEQASPEYIWVPYDNPEEWGNTALTSAGTSSSTLTSTYVETVTTAGTYYWTDTLTGGPSTATFGAIIERQFSVSSGGSLTAEDVAIRVLCQDGTASFEVSIRLTTTGFRAYDVNGAATLGTDVSGLTAGVRYELRIALEAGVLRTWYRVWTWGGLNAWVAGPTGVAAGGAAGANRVVVTWGNIASSTATARWYMGTAAWDNAVGAGLADAAFTNPDDLRGRPWPSTFLALGSTGTLVAAEGATTRGDQVQIEPTAEQGVQMLDEGGPRNPHVAAGTAAETWIYDLQGGADTPIGTDVLVLAEFGSNVAHVKVSGVPASGPDVVLADTSLCIGLDQLQYIREGDCIRPPVSSAGSDVNTPLSTFMEYAGSQFSAYNTGLGAWKTRVIRRNSGGSWAEGAGRRDALYLEGIDGTEPTSGSDGVIIPANWAVLIDMRGQTYEKIKVEFLAPSATIPPPASGKYQHGRRILGYLVPHFHHPSWGSRVSARGHAEVLQTPDRQRRGVELAPTHRTFRLGLVDGIRTYNVINTTLDAQPDWFEVSDHADSEGIGTPGLELHSTEGMLRATRGGLDEIAFFPYLPRFSDSNRVQVLNRREEVALVAFDPDTVISRTRINGLTMYGEHLRGDVYELEEVT